MSLPPSSFIHASSVAFFICILFLRSSPRFSSCHPPRPRCSSVRLVPAPPSHAPSRPRRLDHVGLRGLPLLCRLRPSLDRWRWRRAVPVVRFASDPAGWHHRDRPRLPYYNVRGRCRGRPLQSGICGVGGGGGRGGAQGRPRGIPGEGVALVGLPAAKQDGRGGERLYLN